MERSVISRFTFPLSSFLPCLYYSLDYLGSPIYYYLEFEVCSMPRKISNDVIPASNLFPFVSHTRLKGLWKLGNSVCTCTLSCAQ